MWSETSAKSGEGVADIFTSIGAWKCGQTQHHTLHSNTFFQRANYRRVHHQRPVGQGQEEPTRQAERALTSTNRLQAQGQMHAIADQYT